MPSCPLHGEFAIGAPCPGCVICEKLSPGPHRIEYHVEPADEGFRCDKHGLIPNGAVFCHQCFMETGEQSIRPHADSPDLAMANRGYNVIQAIIDEAEDATETAPDPKGAAGALKAPLWLIPPAGNEEQAKAFQDGINSGYGA